MSEARTDGVTGRDRPLGCALAMRVMQSDLYKQLDDAERADCDELVRQNLEWFKRDSTPGVTAVDPTDPGYDVETLREHVRHLERRIRDLHRERNAGVTVAPDQTFPRSATDGDKQ